MRSIPFMRSTPWLASEAGALLSGEYPGFVYGGRHEPASYIPVFAFHTLDPVEFDAALRYLQDNDYRTVTLDEVVAGMRGEASLPPRSVALTIDDGRLSTWSIGLPLLRARGMVATAFVIPGYPEEGPCRPTLSRGSGAGAGGAGGERPPPPDSSPFHLPEEVDRRTNLRWSEVEALHASGVVAIESHTMLHRRVEVSEQLHGFVTPASLTHPRYAIPLPPHRRNGWHRRELEARLGAPLFESLPILVAPKAWTPPEHLAEACIEKVTAGGGRAFFERKGWKRELENTLAAAGPAPPPSRFDLAEEQRWEIASAKRELEARLPGKRVRHLALPEGAGSPATPPLVRDCGYDSCVWSFLPGSVSNRPGTSPYRIGRLKHDYIFSLPGRRRQTLPRVLLRKSLRRARGRTGY